MSTTTGSTTMTTTKQLYFDTKRVLCWDDGAVITTTRMPRKERLESRNKRLRRVVVPHPTQQLQDCFRTTYHTTLQQQQRQHSFSSSKMVVKTTICCCAFLSIILNNVALIDGFSVFDTVVVSSSRRISTTINPKRYIVRSSSYYDDTDTLLPRRIQQSSATLLYGSNEKESDGLINDELNQQQQQQLVQVDTAGIKTNAISVTSAAGAVATTLSGSSSATTTSTTSISNNPPFLVTVDDATQYSYTEAIQRTIGWVSAAIIFGSTLWITNGATTGEEFFAGYLVEQSLSVDNLFVFLLLFEYFQVPIQYQDRVLNWGIYGAIVMRAIMIGIGSVALQQFHVILLVFAAILVYSSASFFLKADADDEKEDPSQNSIVRFSRSLFPSTDTFDEDRFFTIENGIRMATPLFICMIAVEISDVVFAIDSIPAVFGVTENPLIVFSSNIFAIMGLRSLYTILSKAATDLKYLEPAVALVLGFIGSKMIAEYFDFIIPTNIALAVVATVLSTGVGLSVLEQQQNLNQTKEE